MRKLAPSPENFWLWFGAIWFLVGAPLLAVGAYAGGKALLEWQRLDRDGRVVQGIVVRKSLESRNESLFPRYRVTFRFTATDGDVVEGSARVKREVGDRLEENGPIQVSYLPESPRFHRVEGQSLDLESSVILGLMGAIFGPVGGFLFLRGWRQRQLRRRLEREGLVAEGTVVAVVERNIRINRVPLWTIRYQYSDFTGQSHEGQSRLLWPEEAQDWKVGDTGTVRYDSARPQQSLWVGRPDLP